MGNLAFFYDTFFSTRRSGSPWPVHFAYRMRQAPLPRYPSLVAILHAATTIHHVLSILLSRFFSFSTFSIPLSPLYTTYEYVYYVAPRPPDAKKKNSARVWPTRHRHVLSRWINVSRVRAVAHPLISIQLDRRTLFGLFDNVTCLATRFSWPAEYSGKVGE